VPLCRFAAVQISARIYHACAQPSGHAPKQLKTSTRMPDRPCMTTIATSIEPKPSSEHNDHHDIPDDALNEILNELLHTSFSTDKVLAERNLKVSTFATWITSERALNLFRSLKEISLLRAQILAADRTIRAIIALGTIVSADVESPRHAETIRKAATTLIKLTDKLNTIANTTTNTPPTTDPPTTSPPTNPQRKQGSSSSPPSSDSSSPSTGCPAPACPEAGAGPTPSSSTSDSPCRSEPGAGSTPSLPSPVPSAFRPANPDAPSISRLYPHTAPLHATALA
jgi:hypothetical protein